MKQENTIPSIDLKTDKNVEVAKPKKRQAKPKAPEPAPAPASAPTPAPEAKPVADLVDEALQGQSLTINKGKAVRVTLLDAKLNAVRCKAGNVKSGVLKRNREDLLEQVSELTGDVNSVLTGRCISQLSKAGFISTDDAKLFRGYASLVKGLTDLGVM